MGIPNITIPGGRVDREPAVLRVLVLVRPDPGLRHLGGTTLRWVMVLTIRTATLVYGIAWFTASSAASRWTRCSPRSRPSESRRRSGMTSMAAKQTRQGWHSVLVGGIATFMGAPWSNRSGRDAGGRRAGGIPRHAVRLHHHRPPGGPARPPGGAGLVEPPALLPRRVRPGHVRGAGGGGHRRRAVVPGNAPKTVDLVADAMGEAIGPARCRCCAAASTSPRSAGRGRSTGTRPGTYGLILVDTHLDTAPDVGGEIINHCCPITRAMELDRSTRRSA